MLFVLQNILYCGLYILLVKCAAKNSGLNCLYFYPDEYIEEAHKRKIADKEATMKKGKRFIIPFCIVKCFALILIISVWNHLTDFKSAYIQAVLFLVVVNWFDGIVIDKLWVEHSKIWIIPGMEDVSYAKPWSYMLKRRTLGTIMYLVVALAIAGIVVLIGKI